MDKKIDMNKRCIIFVITILIIFVLYMPKICAENIEWKNCDTICFQNKEKLIEWNKKQLPFSYVNIINTSLSNDSFIISITEGCSGVHCVVINVFKQEKDIWQLILTTDIFSIEGSINYEIDKINNSIDFILTKTKDIIIKLPFEKLGIGK